MKKSEFILYPICKNKTRNKIGEDIVLKNYPLDCQNCRQEISIEAKNLKIIVIKEPDAQMQGRHEELIRQKGIYADFVLGREAAIGWKL